MKESISKRVHKLISELREKEIIKNIKKSFYVDYEKNNILELLFKNK